jgi:branched-chain amino acid transport system substrate-binding protein
MPPAAKLVILEINDGTFSRGFDVTARVIVDRRSEQIFKATLPAAADIPHLYDQWQASYRALGKSTLISVSTTQVTNLSIIGDCTHLSAQLKQRFNQWLNSDSFRTLERSLLLAIGPLQTVRFMVQTGDRYLRRLPWQTWDLFEQHYPGAEVMLSHPIAPPSAPLNSPVRILAVEGNTDGTKACLDLAQLNRLPQTHITVLHQPTANELIDRLWHEDWDMFFFLGHSDSTDDDQNGQIVLNATESVTLSEIHHALKNALKNGLKLAIFNSCNGLGLAQRLADLNIPYVIVMRERVPDQVALEFFKTFLTSFSQGKVLHSALHIARQKLAGYGDRYPCAHWLPVLCQNPNAPELQYPKARKPYKSLVAAGLAISAVGGLLGLPLLRDWYRQEQEFSDRTSLGEKQLDNQIENAQKTAGIEAFGKGNFLLAEQEFLKSLRENANDPETQIYLNNTKIAHHPNKVRIVVSVPLKTSPYVSQEMLRGVAQKQSEFNRHSVGSHPFLEIVIGSDDNNKAITTNLAQHWAKDNRVLAVIGHNAGNASIPASEIYEAAQLPMISPTTYIPLSSENRAYTFQMQARTFSVANLLFDYTKKKFEKKTIAGCVDQKAQDNKKFEEDFKDLVIEQSNIKYISGQCTIDDKDTPEKKIELLKKRGVNVIMIAPFVNELPRSLALARAARKAKLQILGTPSFYTQSTLNEPAMNGFAFPVAWMPNLPGQPNAQNSTPGAETDFYAQALKLWNIPTIGYAPSITWRTAMAYDVTGLLTTIVQTSTSTKATVDRKYIQQQLHSSSFQGITGAISFDHNGYRKTPNQGVMVLVQPSSTPWKDLEFMPIATKP